MIEVRRLTVDDWQANRTIRLEALGECPGVYLTTLAEAEARSEDLWRGMLMSATLVVFGLFDGDALAGIAAINRDGPASATMAMSYIRPPWRGRGLSARLFAARIDWARAHGVATLAVSHRASNTASRRAITRHGFRPTGVQPRRWPDGAVEHDLSYRLDLVPA